MSTERRVLRIVHADLLMPQLIAELTRLCEAARRLHSLAR